MRREEETRGVEKGTDSSYSYERQERKKKWRTIKNKEGRGVGGKREDKAIAEGEKGEESKKGRTREGRRQQKKQD